MDGGETLLHTCVKSNRLEALKLLADLGSLEEFIGFRDDGDSQICTEKNRVKVNEINANGFTALDIICQMPRDLKAVEICEVLQEAGALRARNCLHLHEMLFLTMSLEILLKLQDEYIHPLKAIVQTKTRINRRIGLKRSVMH